MSRSSRDTPVERSAQQRPPSEASADLASDIQAVLDDYGEISIDAWEKRYGCTLAQAIQKVLEER